MALLYLETSALVKVFVEESGSAAVLSLVDPQQGHVLSLLSLTRVEAFAAMARRERAGDLEIGFARAADAVLGKHIAKRYMVQEVTEDLLEDARSIVDRHGLRAYDAMQLAGARAVFARREDDHAYFVTADSDLVRAARQDGLEVVDPNEEGTS